MYENLPNLDFKAFFNMSSTPFTQNIPVEAFYQSEQFLDSMRASAAILPKQAVCCTYSRPLAVVKVLC